MIVVFAIFTLLTFMLCLIRPKWVVYLFCFLVPVEYFFVFGDRLAGEGHTLIKFVSVGLLGGWICQMIRSPEYFKHVLGHLSWRPLVALAAFGLISILWVDDPRGSLLGVYKNLSGGLLILSLFSLIGNLRELGFCLKALFAGMILCATYTLYQYYVLIPAGVIQGVRAGDFTGGHSVNHTAELLTVGFPLCLFAYRQRLSRFWRTVSIFAGFIMIAAVATTLSRTAYATVGLFVLIEGFSALRKSRIAFASLLILCVVIAAAVATKRLDQSVFNERVEKTAAIFSDEASTFQSSSRASEYRLQHWMGAIAMFLDHPLFGVGSGGYGRAFGEEYQFTYGNQNSRVFGINRTAHSTTFTLLAELGVVGFAFWVWFMWVWYKSCFGSYLFTRLRAQESYVLLLRAWWVLFVVLCTINHASHHKILWLVAGLSFVFQKTAQMSVTAKQSKLDNKPIVSLVRDNVHRLRVS